MLRERDGRVFVVQSVSRHFRFCQPTFLLIELASIRLKLLFSTLKSYFWLLSLSLSLSFSLTLWYNQWYTPFNPTAFVLTSLATDFTFKSRSFRLF
jgi:hypothetical protein